jgi:hypothetical protein
MRDVVVVEKLEAATELVDPAAELLPVPGGLFAIR